MELLTVPATPQHNPLPDLSDGTWWVVEQSTIPHFKVVSDDGGITIAEGIYVGADARACAQAKPMVELLVKLRDAMKQELRDCVQRRNGILTLRGERLHTRIADITKVLEMI